MLEPAAALRDDRRVVAAPLAHGIVDDRQVHRAEHAQRRRELALGLPVAREGAHDDDRDVDEHAEQRGGEPGIPDPVDAPGLLRPERPAGQHHDAEDHRTLGAGLGPSVPLVGELEQKADAAHQAHHARQVHGVGAGHVEVEDLLRQPAGFGLRQRRLEEHEADQPEEHRRRRRDQEGKEANGGRFDRGGHPANSIVGSAGKREGAGLRCRSPRAPRGRRFVRGSARTP